MVNFSTGGGQIINVGGGILAFRSKYIFKEEIWGKEGK